MTGRRAKAVAIIGALAFVAASAGCSSSGGSSAAKTTTSSHASTTPTTTAAQRAALAQLPDPCTLLSKADVTALFHAAPLRTLPQPPLVQTLLKSCAISGEYGRTTRALIVGVASGTAAYAQALASTGKPVPGLGEKSYVAAHALGNTLIIQFVRNGRTYSVTYSATDPNGAIDPATQQAQLVAMMKAIDRRVS